MIYQSPQPYALFIGLILMLSYKTIDLFTAKEKILQLMNSNSPFLEPTLSFSIKRLLLEKHLDKVKRIRFTGLILLRFYSHFLPVLFMLYFITLTLGGVLAILYPDDRSVVSITVALSTACVSLVGSTINYIIDNIKSN